MVSNGKSLYDRLDFLPNTFTVTFLQLLSMTIANITILFLLWFVIWPNEGYNKIFNDGIKPFHGWQCGEKHPNSGYFIFLGSQLGASCLYTISLFFCVLDYYLEKNGRLQDYKVLYPPPRPLQKTINWRLYKKSIFLARMNALFSMFFVPVIFIPLMEWRGVCDTIFFHHEDDQHISLWYDIGILIIKFAMMPFLSDLIFYVTHRANHEIGFLYRNVHKIHHQFVETYAISATASHPLEHLICNLVTVIGAPLIMNLPLFWFLCFLSLASIQTTFGHSGYGNPFRKIKLANATPHDFHHHYQNCEFGSGARGFIDKLFGTRLQDIYPKRWEEIKEEYYKYDQEKQKKTQ